MPPRIRAFVAVAVVCAAALVGVILVAALGRDDSGGVRLDAGAGAPAQAVRAVDPRMRMVVRAVSAKGPRLDGRLYEVTAAGRTRPISHAPACERIAVAAGRGICLYLARTGVDYRAAVLDRRFRVRHVLGLPGLPSRARVSPGGRYGAVTSFASGDSYTAPGTFSTRTQILDLAAGRVVADLEQWRFTRDGRVADTADRNFWGVTFGADEDRFYATMATGDHHYLVRGSIRARGGEVIRDRVECPSLSPDGTRIAYKYPLGGARWRLHVYDLRTRADVALAERRSIDDQAAWVDDDHVSYSDGRSTWVADSDGAGRPQLLVRGADSATILRRTS
jgi:hypothetical protein